MSNYTSPLTGCPGCGVVYIDANICQNCFISLTPEQVWEIHQNLITRGAHVYAKIINSTLHPPEFQATIDQASTSGATCCKCKEFYPYAIKSDPFECWACKNNF